ncbi:hypothetical protein [Neglectibacter timonensis]|nr:hypothetical protein [Neglectibacter timonensis]
MKRIFETVFCGFQGWENPDFAVQNHPQFHEKGMLSQSESHGL